MQTYSLSEDSVVSDDPKYKTSHLGLGSADTEPMRDRPASPQEETIKEGWKLQVNVGGNEIVLDISKAVVVGRSVDDEVVENLLDFANFAGYEKGVSRRHAVISRDEDSLYIEDQGSTNGTQINSFQLTAKRKYRLRDGDVVDFARLNTLFKFVSPEE
jgi:pSer/pThr/pTyr-binding forkhead associated (FHA) protein